MTGYTFNQLFDFTRTTSGTFVGSNGILQTTPASVNLLTFTQEFDNAAWGKSNATVAANSTLAPDGTATADTFIDDVVNGPHNAVENVSSAVAGQTYTLSLYAKASTSSVIQILGRVATMGTNVWANFNLATGTIGAVGASTTASIVNVGNGWYRCIVTGVAVANGTGILAFLLTNNDANAVRQPSYAGTGTGVFLWGAQLELGSTATTYARNNGGLFPPRFDYDPVTLAPRGILIEEQRTNRVLQSENFTVSPWDASIGGSSTRVNDGSPLGFTRGLITATSANGGIRQIISGLSSGQVYAMSFYIQSTTTSVAVIFENGPGTFGSAHSVVINPSNGTAGALTGFTSVSIQAFGPGYVYTLITAPAGAALIANVELRITNSGNSIWFGRPQFEAGAFPTSYIPTVASQVTRSADVCTISAPMFAPWYNQPAGTFVAQFDYSGGTSADNPSGRFVIAASNATPNNLHAIYNRTSVAQSGLTSDGGVTQAAPGAGTSLGTNAVASAAYAYSQNDFAFSYGGSAAATDASGTVPVNLTILGIGGSGYATPAFINGHIRRVTYYPFRASNNQIQALST